MVCRVTRGRLWSLPGKEKLSLLLRGLQRGSLPLKAGGIKNSREVSSGPPSSSSELALKHPRAELHHARRGVVPRVPEPPREVVRGEQQTLEVGAAMGREQRGTGDGIEAQRGGVRLLLTETPAEGPKGFTTRGLGG